MCVYLVASGGSECSGSHTEEMSPGNFSLEVRSASMLRKVQTGLLFAVRQHTLSRLIFVALDLKHRCPFRASSFFFFNSPFFKFILHIYHGPPSLFSSHSLPAPHPLLLLYLHSDEVKPPIGINKERHIKLRQGQAPLPCTKAEEGIPP